MTRAIAFDFENAKFETFRSAPSNPSQLKREPIPCSPNDLRPEEFRSERHQKIPRTRACSRREQDLCDIPCFIPGEYIHNIYNM